MVHTARAAGFSNVHDYLINLKTHESQQTISERKRGRGWCQTGQSPSKKQKVKYEREERTRTRVEGNTPLTSGVCTTQEKAQPNDLVSERAEKITSNPPSSKLSIEHPSTSDALNKKRSQQIIEGSATPYPLQPKSEPGSRLAPDETITLPPSLKVKKEHQEGPIALSQPTITPVTPPPLQQTSEFRSQLMSDKSMTQMPLSQVKVERQPEPVIQAHSNRNGLLYKPCQRLVTESERLAEGPATPPSLYHMSELQSQLTMDDSVAQQPPLEVKDGSFLPSQLIIDDASNLELQKLEMQLQSTIEGPVTPLQPKTEPGSHLRIGDSESELQVKSEHQSFHSRDRMVSPPQLHSRTLSSNMAAAFCRSENDSVWSMFGEEFDLSLVSSIVEDGNKSAVLSPCDSDGNHDSENGSTVLIRVKEEQTSCPINDENFTECIRRQASPGIAAKNSGLISSDAERILGHDRPRPMLLKESAHDLQLLRSVKVEKVYNDDIDFNRAFEDDIQQIGARTSVGCSQQEGLPCIVTVKEEVDDSWEIDRFPKKKCIGDSVPLVNCDVYGEVVDSQLVQVIYIDDDEDEDEDCVRDTRMPQALNSEKAVGSGAPTYLWMVDDFRKKLEAKLLEPFNTEELEDLLEAVSHRKPIYRARETRQRSSQFITQEEGYSYLDHHPDLAYRLQSTDCPKAKLALLRGFFIWLKHASTLGAFKPWTTLAPSSKKQEDDDCIEIDGLDCEILAVVCPVDELNVKNFSKWSKGWEQSEDCLLGNPSFSDAEVKEEVEDYLWSTNAQEPAKRQLDFEDTKPSIPVLKQLQRGPRH